MGRVERWRKTQRRWVERHRRIRKFLEEYPRSYILVNSAARKLGMDPRNLRIHLEIMEMHGVGTFLETSKGLFFVKTRASARRE